MLLLCLRLKEFTLGFALVLCFSIGLAITLVTVGALAALSVRHATKRWSWFSTVATRAVLLEPADHRRHLCRHPRLAGFERAAKGRGTCPVAATVFPAQSEAVLMGMILSGDWSVLALTAVSSVGNTLGAVVNWFLGLSVERLKDRPWFPVRLDKLARAQSWYRRYGKWNLLASWCARRRRVHRRRRGHERAATGLRPLGRHSQDRPLWQPRGRDHGFDLMWTWIIGFQREIYLALAEHILGFADGGSLVAFPRLPADGHRLRRCPRTE